MTYFLAVEPHPSPSAVLPTTSDNILTPSPASGSGSGPLLDCEYDGQLSYNVTVTYHPDGLTSETVRFRIGRYVDTLLGEISYPVVSSLSQLHSLDQQCSIFSITIANFTNDYVTAELTYMDYNFDTSCTFNLTVAPPDDAPPYCPPVDISVSVTVIPLPTCSDTTGSISASQYNSIASALSVLNCSVHSSSSEVLYSVRFNGGGFQTAEGDFSPIFADYFIPRSHNVSITVCESKATSVCSETPLEIVFDVRRHEGRLFPFGEDYSDYSLDYADDRAVPVVIPKAIPFWSYYYRQIYVSSQFRSL